MADDRISDLLVVLKHQVSSQEILLEYLVKVEAMVEIILAKDLIEFSKEKLHNYLWAVSDLAGRARTLNEDLLSKLVRISLL